MLADAPQQVSSQDVDAFLKSGWFLGFRDGLCLIGWGKSKRAAKPDGSRVQAYLPDFYLESKNPWVGFEHWAYVETSIFANQLMEFANQPRLDLSFVEPRLEEFQSAFEKIQNEIREGRLQKAVPVVFARARSSVTKAMRAFAIANLLRRAKEQLPYGYMTPTEGMLGATPETLFSYREDAGEIESMALAGTRRSEDEKANPLLKDKKECIEHDFVVQGLKAKLARLGEVEFSEPQVWDIGTLSHLRTEMKVKIAHPSKADLIFQEVCQLLHPTAALGVAPVSADWRLLKNFEGSIARNRYGAPFGIVVPGSRALAVVAIRNIQWDEEGAVLLGSGCGIVQLSELHREWQELQLKRRSVRDLLGL